jgi:hypothetical protein
MRGLGKYVMWSMKADRELIELMQLDHICTEIERMRLQVHRQRGDIRQLQQAGISMVSAEALLERMLGRIDELCAERDRLKKEQGPVKSKALGGRSW